VLVNTRSDTVTVLGSDAVGSSSNHYGFVVAAVDALGFRITFAVESTPVLPADSPYQF